MEMAKIAAQLKLEEQKIQIQMDMEKATLAQDKELADQRLARDDARLRRTELDQIAKNITRGRASLPPSYANLRIP